MLLSITNDLMDLIMQKFKTTNFNFNPSGTKGHLFTCKNPTGQATFNILQVLRFAQLGGYRLCSAHDVAPNGKKLLMFQRYVVPFKCQEALTHKSGLS
jgi:hypothetical protein